MASMRMLLLLAALGCAAAELAAGTVSFERYQPLVDRHPFGRPPEGFDPDKMSSEVSKSAASAKPEALTGEQAEIAKNVTFSVINKEPDGTVRVGFSDNADPKQPHHYYMGVGETRDGWTVKEADPAEKTMTLVSRDGVEVSLELGGSSAGKGAAAGKPAGRAPAHDRSSLLGAGGGQLGSFRARRALRAKEAAENEARRAAAEEERKKLAEAEREEREKERMSREAEREEQRRQLEAIREELRRNREMREANANGEEAVD